MHRFDKESCRAVSAWFEGVNQSRHEYILSTSKARKSSCTPMTRACRAHSNCSRSRGSQAMIWETLGSSQRKVQLVSMESRAKSCKGWTNRSSQHCRKRRTSTRCRWQIYRKSLAWTKSMTQRMAARIRPSGQYRKPQRLSRKAKEHPWQS